MGLILLVGYADSLLHVLLSPLEVVSIDLQLGAIGIAVGRRGERRDEVIDHDGVGSRVERLHPDIHGKQGLIQLGGQGFLDVGRTECVVVHAQSRDAQTISKAGTYGIVECIGSRRRGLHQSHDGSLGIEQRTVAHCLRHLQSHGVVGIVAQELLHPAHHSLRHLLHLENAHTSLPVLSVCCATASP